MNKIDYFKEKGINVVDKMPKGWRYIIGATTAPPGYKWICNNKSMFSKEYEHALLKVRTKT